MYVFKIVLKQLVLKNIPVERQATARKFFYRSTVSKSGDMVNLIWAQLSDTFVPSRQKIYIVFHGPSSSFSLSIQKVAELLWAHATYIRKTQWHGNNLWVLPHIYSVKDNLFKAAINTPEQWQLLAAVALRNVLGVTAW